MVDIAFAEGTSDVEGLHTRYFEDGGRRWGQTGRRDHAANANPRERTGDDDGTA